MSGSLYAESLEDLQIKKLNAEHWSEFVRGSDTVMMTLYYVGTGTEAVVTITSKTIQSFVPAGTVDTGFGVENSSYSFATSTTNSIGELCDVINVLTNYNCILRAARPGDLPLYLRDQIQTTDVHDLKALGGFHVQIDSGATISASVAPIIASDPGSSWQAVSRQPVANKRSTLQRCDFVGSGGPAVNSRIHMRVYGKLRKYEGLDDSEPVRDTDTIAWGPVAFDTDTAKSFNWDLNGVGGMEFARGEPLVVVVAPISTATLVNRVATDYISCQGMDE